MPFYCESELEESKEGFVEAKDMYHPLLSEPVANSIYEHHPVLLTGSNASGKSTFLKTVAINALFITDMWYGSCKGVSFMLL